MLAELLRLDQPEPWTTKLAQLFAIQNEHRLFTSRVLFGSIYRLTGKVDFVAIGVLGNLFLFGLCAILLERAGARARVARLAVLLGLVVFQLQHYENFFWSGSSIDHFNVVLLATGAFAALTDNTRRGLLGGLLLGLLGTYTLAHGFVIWPVGAALLAVERRWLPLACWGGAAAAAAACYIPGFFVNPAHHIEASANVLRVTGYWLALIGATPACGELSVAPWLGAALLGCGLWLTWRQAWRFTPLAAMLVAFCILSLALVAVGRTGVSEGILLPSRYSILSALAWALTLWVAVEHELALRKCHGRTLLALTAALVALNVANDIRFFDQGAKFASGREAAAAQFRYFHTIAGSTFALYPRPNRADQILREAERRGIYRLPYPTRRIDVPWPRKVDHLTYAIDDLTIDAENVYLRGWAFLPGRESESDELNIVFQSDRTFRVYRAVTISRPDVAAAFHNPNLRLSGFSLVVPRHDLPEENLTVGVLFKRPWRQAELAVTRQRLALASKSDDKNAALTAQ